ncbi:MAG: cellulase family glycosylhydrolase [Hyphomicrobiaceae bacterium]
MKVDGTRFVLNGKTFPVAGVNNHYLSYGSKYEVLRVLDDAKDLGVNVIRTFNHPVIGSRDGKSRPTIWNFHARAESSNLGVHGVYMLYWDDAKQIMAVNEGPDGIGRLDFLIAEARKREIRLIIPFLDFWAYTGGAQQMRAWYGSEDKHRFFFEDERTRADFKTWIRYLLTRVNPLTGITYKDDPTIMAWELMNEPYAKPETLYLRWVAEMSAYAKTIDPNHPIGSGHAGISNKMSEVSIASIDFLTWHGYPLYYKLTVDSFDELIGKQCAIGREHGKPVLLEEFGWARSNPGQVEAYNRWLGTLASNRDCAGWLAWRLVSIQEHGKYPDDRHDQFDFHRHSGALWNTVKQAIERFKSREP